MNKKKLKEEICQLLLIGESTLKIAALDHMPTRQTIMNWLARDEEFAKEYVLAKATYAEILLEESLSIADDVQGDLTVDNDGNERVDHENIQRAKLRVDTRLKLAEKLAPRKYGKTINQNIGGTDGGAIEYRDLSQEQINDEIKRLLSKVT